MRHKKHSVESNVGVESEFHLIVQSYSLSTHTKRNLKIKNKQTNKQRGRNQISDILGTNNYTSFTNQKETTRFFTKY